MSDFNQPDHSDENRVPNSLVDSHDVYTDGMASIPISLSLHSSGVTSPQRRRNMKDYEQQMDKLKKENFDLRLRIYLLEETINKKPGKGDKSLQRVNLDLKVENETLKRELSEKQELVSKTGLLIYNLEEQFKEQLSQTEAARAKDIEELEKQLTALQKEIMDLKEASDKPHSLADLTDLCELAFSSAAAEATNPVSADGLKNEDAVARNSLSVSDGERICCDAGLRLRELEAEARSLTDRVEDLSASLEEKERVSRALREDIFNLKKEMEEREEKLADLDQEVSEKDQRIDHLMQDLETRHQEIACKETKIQTLNEDLRKVEPEIEVKILEINEKSRIIEEKNDQIQQQNKILVEIQITLDEKVKQISEMEEELAQAKRDTQSSNEQLDVSLMTIKMMTESKLNQDKQFGQVKKELKNEQKKVKNLLAELREALDMLKKAQWEAEAGAGRHNDVADMVEEESERLWAELEQKKDDIVRLQSKYETLLKEAKEEESKLMVERDAANARLQSLESELLQIKTSQSSCTPDCLSKMSSLNEKLESRESCLKRQNELTEKLKLDLQEAKSELSEKVKEIKDLRVELTTKNNDVFALLSKASLGNQSEIKLLSDQLSRKADMNELVNIFKSILDCRKDSVDVPEKRDVSLNVDTLKSSDDQRDRKSSCGTAKLSRSNSFSLLENALFANLGQKMCNTNQTFNTYIFSGENNSSSKCDENFQNAQNENGRGSAMHIPYNKKDQIVILPSHINGDKNSIHNVDVWDHSFNALIEELKVIREEIVAFNSDQKSLTLDFNLVRKLLQPEEYQLAEFEETANENRNTDAEECIKDSPSDYAFDSRIISLKDKYRQTFDNYKRSISSLKQKLTLSQTNCDLFKKRLEELSEFMESIVEMERRGEIDLSHLSCDQRLSLHKTLDESRLLSQSQLMDVNSMLSTTFNDIGINSILNASIASLQFNDTINCIELDIVSDISSLNNEYLSILRDIYTRFDTKSNLMGEIMSRIFAFSEKLEKCIEGYHVTTISRSNAVLPGTDSLKHSRCSTLNLNEGSSQHAENINDDNSDTATEVKIGSLYRSNKETSPPSNLRNASNFISDGVEPDTEANHKEDNRCEPIQEMRLFPRLSNASLLSQSESEAWSEPDRDVSWARIGLDFIKSGSICQQDGISVSRNRSSKGQTLSTETEEEKDDAYYLGELTTSKQKRSRTDVLEIKRLQAQINSLQDLNDSLKSEINIYQKIETQSFPPNHSAFSERTTVEDGRIVTENYSESGVEPSMGNLLIQEIHDLRMKLEDSMSNNNELRSHLISVLANNANGDYQEICQKLHTVQSKLKESEEKLSFVLQAQNLHQQNNKDDNFYGKDITAEMKSYEIRNQELENQNKILNEELNAVQLKLSRSETLLNELKSAKSSTEQNAEVEESLIKQLRQELVSVTDDMCEVKQLLEEKKTQIETLKNYISALEKSNFDTESKLKNSEIINCDLEKMVRELQERLKSDSKTAELTSLKKSLEESESRTLKATKEKLALVGENSLLQSQVTSLVMRNNLLENDIKIFSQKHPNQKDNNETISKSSLDSLSIKISNINDQNIEQDEENCAQIRKYEMLNKEQENKIQYLTEKYEKSMRQFKYLESEKIKIETKLLQIPALENEIKNIRLELTKSESIKKQLDIQLKTERNQNNSLQNEMKILISNSTNDRDTLKPRSRLSSDIYQRNELSLPSSRPTSNLPSDTYDPWGSDKENLKPPNPTLQVSGPLPTPIIDSQKLADSSEHSPDLGIEGSDGMSSSMETNSAPRQIRFKQSKIQNITLDKWKCNNPEHDSLASDLEVLLGEYDALRSKLGLTEFSLESVKSKLAEANRQNQSREMAVKKQLTKTHQVLKKAKVNLKQYHKSNDAQSVPKLKNDQS